MKKASLLLCAMVLTLPLRAQIHFSDITLMQGIVHQYEGGMAGGGVSFFDFNNDGWDDLTFATSEGTYLKFYQNVNGTFNSMFPLIGHQGETKHILWVDFDNDGDQDLYITTVDEPNRLYENVGNLTFEDITISAGLPINDHRSFGACWGDYDRDGWLDLYYGERKFPIGSGVNENRLFHNNADGSFTEVTISSGAQDPGKKPFCSSFIDFNNDNWPDLYTANDKKSINTLLKNNGDGTFTDIGETANADIEMDAMGIAIGDYDNDGWQDLYVANLPEGNKLLHNLGYSEEDDEVVFEEIANSSGVGFFGIAWGTNFFDADNDGLLDLYVNSLILGEDIIPNTFYLNEGTGQFSELEVGFADDDKSSFCNAIGDFDQDGFPDIIVAGYDPNNARLWNNSGGDHNWIKIDLQGVLSNRPGIGSKIECYVGDQYQMRTTHCGIAFMGQNSGTEIIGLGAATVIDSLVITWPTGHIDHLYDIRSNQKILVTEGNSTGGNIEVDPDVELNIVANEELQASQPVIRISPNPASTNIIIHQNRNNFSYFMLLDESGKLFSSGELSLKQEQINIEDFPQGLYYVITWDEKKNKNIVQFIKH
jgi:hypothetical protein